jgi:hypothetical protein
MIAIALPQEIALTCTACKTKFTIAADCLHGRDALSCPLCASRFAVVDALDPALRLRIYHAVRGLIESRVYEQQQLDEDYYFEDGPNL